MAAAFKIFRKIPNSRLPLINSIRFKSQKNSIKVTLCGAAGTVGQPLSLLLKQSPYIDELALYDLRSTEGLALELSYVDTRCKVTSYNESVANEAFLNTSIVILACGTPTSTQEEHDASYKKNAHKVKELAKLIATYSPHALIAVALNPVDGMVPLMAECLKQKITFNPAKLLGVTTLNVIRANTFVAEVQGMEPECVNVPVIGGNTMSNIVPVLSNAKPCNDLTDEEISQITKAIHCAHKDIVKLKIKEGPTLSSSFAIARFVISMIKGLKGMSGIIECAFVRTDVYPNTKYFATPVLLGPNGVQKHLGVTSLSPYEKMQLETAVYSLQNYQKQAKEFLGVKEKKPCDPCDPKVRTPCPEDVCAKKKRKESMIPVEEM